MNDAGRGEREPPADNVRRKTGELHNRGANRQVQIGGALQPDLHLIERIRLR
jgi:hypothetical protein